MITKLYVPYFAGHYQLWMSNVNVCMMVYNDIASKYKLLARVILCPCI